MRRVFDSMGHKNLVSWIAMIVGYMHNSLHHEAMAIIVEMSRLFHPDAFACTSIFNFVYLLHRLWNRGSRCLAILSKVNPESDDYVQSGLIDNNLNVNLWSMQESCLMSWKITM